MDAVPTLTRLEGRPLLRSTKPEEELAVQCIQQVSMLLAEEGDEANAATATAFPESASDKQATCSSCAESADSATKSPRA